VGKCYRAGQATDNVGKCYRGGQAIDNNMAYAHCKLDNYGYKHTLRLRNTHCFSTATMATRTHICYVMRTLPVLC
jgi:hypothetical protein